MSQISIHLRDLGKPLVAAWEREFKGAANVTISCGDIFSNKPGQVTAADPIDIKADAIVSPANSFGFMNGGIDLVYTYQFGIGLQQRLQARIVAEHHGELPVGDALIVETNHPDIPWCISAPTMRTPTTVADTINAFLAFRATLRAVLDHNASNKSRINSILCSGLGTAVGRMPVERCARQMRVAWNRVLGGQPFWPSRLAEAADDELMLLR